jgi:transcriptional regulator with XRE-family HTH domain
MAKVNKYGSKRGGGLVRHLREDRGLTLEQLGANIGKGPAELSQIENGQSLGVRRARLFGDFFKVDYELFLPETPSNWLGSNDDRDGSTPREMDPS